MPFVYSIIWFINRSGSIFDTIKNLFLIAYSGKITLFTGIFVFYTQQVRHPGILNNRREPLICFYGTGQRHVIPCPLHAKILK